MKVKRILAILMALAMMLSLAACGSEETAVAEETATEEVHEQYDLTVGACSTGGTMYQWVVAACETVNQNSDFVTLNAVTTSGSAENINLCDTGELDLGGCSPITIYNAITGKDQYEGDQKNNLTAVYGAYPAYFLIYTTADNPANDIMEMEGQRMSLDTASNSPSRYELCRALGIDPDTFFQMQALNIGDSCSAMQSGTLDGYLMNAGKGSSGAQEQLASPVGLKLIGFTDDEIDQICAAMPLVKPAVYEDFGLDPVNCVAGFNYLIANKEVPAEAIEEICRCLTENQDDLINMFASGTETTPANTTEYLFMDLHEGAEKYFTENGYK